MLGVIVIKNIKEALKHIIVACENCLSTIPFRGLGLVPTGLVLINLRTIPALKVSIAINGIILTATKAIHGRM